MNRSHRLILIAPLTMLFEGALGQSFNIDLDVFFGSPETGNGAPSSQFGGAAEQPGYWNRVAAPVGTPVSLLGLCGQSTGVTVTKFADHAGGSGGFNFQGNTGDYALLLNDAEQVATLVSGGTMTHIFSGLGPGIYDLYTYAAHIAGAQVDTPVFMPEAVQFQMQIVTGPMPGNSLEYLITHSIHRFEVNNGNTVHVTITQPPGLEDGMHINGFQIKTVPEINSAGVAVFGAAFILFRNIHSKRGKNA